MFEPVNLSEGLLVRTVLSLESVVMTTIPTLLFAAGIFVGNWLVTPLFFKDRSRKDGFFIGIIATVLYLCIMALAGFITVG